MLRLWLGSARLGFPFWHQSPSASAPECPVPTDFNDAFEVLSKGLRV